MKTATWQAEWDYRFIERLGILTDGGPVTAEIRAIAKEEADKAEEALREVARQRRQK